MNKLDKHGKIIKKEPAKKPRCEHCGKKGVALNRGYCVSCYYAYVEDYRQE